jgi:hypothetical protein
LLKRAQTNRETAMKISVINHFPGKKKSFCKEEEYRFKRFLGSAVNYTKLSFEEFVADPTQVLAWGRHASA